MIVASLLIVFIAATLFALGARSAFSGTIEVSDDSLTYRRGKKATKIRWSDVRALENRRSSQRLKVFGASGDVINVEYQIAGFRELAEAIAARSGRSITGLMQSTERIPQGNIEIEPPKWSQYLLFVFVPVGAYFFCIRFFVVAWRQHNGGYALIGILGSWAIVKAIRNWWFQLGLRLRMDQRGIQFQTRKELISLAWGDISTAQLEYTDGDSWFIVRDRGGEPRLALKRRFFNWSSGAMKRYDGLVAAARQRTVTQAIK